MADIKHYLVIDTPASKVYEAITSQKGLAGWWTLETTAHLVVRGFKEFKFGDRFYNKMKNIELTPNKKVEWECVQAEPDWIGTHIVFDLEEKDDKTTLRFAHQGWREANDFYASCNYNWGQYMKSIKLLCETGKGKPFGA